MFEVLAAAGLLARPVSRDANGCLVWSGGKTSAGYGQIYRQPRKPEYVHIVAYRAAVGEIPPGWHVDHVWERGCRSRACFWPEHLEAVAPAENARRAGLTRRQRHPRACGHGWDEDRNGRSDCAACHREAEARRKAPERAVTTARFAARTAQISQLAKEGYSRAQIAAEVGCSVGTVRRTLLGLGKRY